MRKGWFHMSMNDYPDNVRDSDLSLKRLFDTIPEKELKSLSYDDLKNFAPEKPAETVLPPVEKRLNTAIYEGFTMCCISPGMARSYDTWINRVKSRVRELFNVGYGAESSIYELGLDYVGNVLIEDAVKNHTRDFLPDSLISEYDRRVGKDDGL